MAGKFTFTVLKGGAKGKSFTYEGKENLILGRQNDCAVILPEGTVSRYHCLVEITPPTVTVRDFGSRNGTYLNGNIIGQRAPGVSYLEARETRGAEFPLKHGDVLGLGGDCSIKIEIILPQLCADCFKEIPEPGFKDPEGLPICKACFDKREQERIKQEENAKIEKAKIEKEKIEKDKIEKNRIENVAPPVKEPSKPRGPRCGICGASIPEGTGICEACQKDPMKILMFLMEQAVKGADEANQIAGYRKTRMLGQGGMGQVWLVEEESTGKQMALKLMLPKAAANDKNREMFIREGSLACQLKHKNIVNHFKLGQSGGLYFILMEYCDGGSVDSLLKKNKKLSIDQASNIILQVLDGLIYAHNADVSAKIQNGGVVSVKGIVHRDFKPANIFLAGQGKNMAAKVADFGLAKAFETAGLSGGTMSGQTAGTPFFMPRQQILDYRYSKPDVDVWAAAASFYNMLTGSYVKDIQQGRDAIAAILTSEAVPILKRNASIPKRLAGIIDEALREKPGIGIKSAAELKKLIEGAL